jgi:hypothetical protein
MSIEWLWEHLKESEGSQALAAMLSAHQRPVAFVVGSALSAPDPAVPDDRGVPGVAGMIERIRAVFADGDVLAEFDRRVRDHSRESAYAAAMHFLIYWRGREAVQMVVRDAVLEAHRDPQPGRDWSDEELKGIDDHDPHGWVLPAGVRGLAALLVRRPNKYPGPVLTTNFDPLVSVGIQCEGGRPNRTVLYNDGRLPGDDYDSPVPLHVVHLHGYWRGGATLHTAAQLTAPRPMLGESLRRMLREKTVVVIGYGGWSDAFMKALRAMLFDNQIDVVWCFHERSTDQLMDRYRRLLEDVDELIQRSQFRTYVGIDCRTIFDSLLKDLATESVPSAESPHQQPRPAEMAPSKVFPSLLSAPAEHDGEQTAIDLPRDMVGLRSDQVNDLREAVHTFERFLAAAARLADESPGRLAGRNPNTVVVLLTGELLRRLERLQLITVSNWPDVGWATRIGGLVAQALRDWRRSQHRALPNEPPPEELLRAVEGLRDLIARQYPSVCALDHGGKLDQGGNRKSSVPENSS